jgi:cytochrome P450
VELDLAHAEDPVDLLARALRSAGGVLRVEGSAGADTVYFHPHVIRLAEFHAAERSGALENHNTPSVEELFAGTVFILSGPAHQRARAALTRYFGRRGTWDHEITRVVNAWARRASAAGQVDLLDQTRHLALDVFTKVVLGVEPGSAAGRRVGDLAREFVTGAVEAAGRAPDRAVLGRAAAARDELIELFSAPGEVGGSSFAAHCHRQASRPDEGRDVSAVLIASVETTANLMAWTIARWTLSPVSERANLPAFARMAERLDSPNTIITRRVVRPLRFEGATLGQGDLLAFSPAVSVCEGPAGTGAATRAVAAARGPAGSIAFGSGPRACPGRSMARHVVEAALAAVAAQPSPWSLVNDDLPRPVTWFPVRTFGPGALVRTSA